MSKKNLAVVLIGAGGNMRGAHVPRILDDGNVKVVGVADPVAEQSATLCKRLGYEVPRFENWRAMLKRCKSDAVLISTPHSEHNTQVRASINDGRHVLVEKPLVIRPSHARALLKLAKEKKRLLLVAYQRHWMRPYVYARELISNGTLGEIRGVAAYVTQDWTAISGWRLDPARSGGGMFMDTGSHLVAALLWSTGLQPNHVSATLDRSDKRVDVNMALHVSFRGGAVGSLVTIGNASRHDERLMVSGEKGCLILHLHQWQVKSMLLNDELVVIPKRIKSATPDSAFFSAIRRGFETVEPADFAIEVSRLTDAAYRSIDKKTSIKIR